MCSVRLPNLHHQPTSGGRVSDPGILDIAGLCCKDHLWWRVEEPGKLVGVSSGVHEAGIASSVLLGGVHLLKDGLDALAVAVQVLQIAQVWRAVHHQISPGCMRQTLNISDMLMVLKQSILLGKVPGPLNTEIACRSHLNAGLKTQKW